MQQWLDKPHTSPWWREAPPPRPTESWTTLILRAVLSIGAVAAIAAALTCTFPK